MMALVARMPIGVADIGKEGAMKVLMARDGFRGAAVTLDAARTRLGNVSQQLAWNAPCSVLIVRG